MQTNRPRGREKNITGVGKPVKRRGGGLGTGPVGSGNSGGFSGNGFNTAGGTNYGASQRGAGQRRAGGRLPIIVLLLALLLGGGGVGSWLLGGSGNMDTQSGQTSGVSTQQPAVSMPNLFSGFTGGGSTSSGWDRTANVGRLDETVASGARDKYTQIIGNGRDTVTIMVYMCGTDLESKSGMATSDLQEMLGAEIGGNVNLIVYTGGCTGWRNNVVSSSVNQIYQVRNGKLACLVENAGTSAMTAPETLSSFIRWGAESFPANRNILILWDHGGGSLSGFGYDEKNPRSGSMGLAGIKKALDNGGIKYDFIGFDACLMATMETALMLGDYADYLIASEETEPGVGWYYTNWLTKLSKNTSMHTIEIGKNIVDDFVDFCAQKCSGQQTTLSVVDLAELEATVPSKLTDFSKAANQLIQNDDYRRVSDARSEAREFARSSKIDQVDLVHLADNLDNSQGEALAKAVLGAVKYNRTSSGMTNAYGLSIYFPYRKAGSVDKAVAAYEQIGMDKEYANCIREFAGLEVSGQAAAGGTGSPLPSLLGTLGGSSGGALDSGAITQLLTGLLGGSFGRVSGLDASNSAFLQDRDLSTEAAAEYLSANRFDESLLVWQEGTEGKVISLPESQWELVHELELNMFYDDGEGYIDLGLDNVFDFDENGGLLEPDDRSWLAINGQPVAYYHLDTVDDGEDYTITGRVPAMLNGERVDLLLVFDNDTPFGRIAGALYDYQGQTDTVSKVLPALEDGDVLEFLCDYYTYDGVYQDSYYLGEPITIYGQPVISNVVVAQPGEGTLRVTYRFTDIYGRSAWTQALEY